MIPVNFIHWRRKEDAKGATWDAAEKLLGLGAPRQNKTSPRGDLRLFGADYLQRVFPWIPLGAPPTSAQLQCSFLSCGILLLYKKCNYREATVLEKPCVHALYNSPHLDLSFGQDIRHVCEAILDPPDNSICQMNDKCPPLLPIGTYFSRSI